MPRLRDGRKGAHGVGRLLEYAYVRHDSASGQRFLVVANLQGQETLRDVQIKFPPEAVVVLRAGTGDGAIEFRDRLAPENPIRLRANGLEPPPLRPLTAYYFELL